MKINHCPDVISDWDCYIFEKANKGRKKLNESKDIKREKTRMRADINEKSRSD